MTDLLLRGGQVFDGHRFVGQQDVRVAHGVITESVGAGARVVDCSGSTVMPGVIDAHVHLAWAGEATVPQDLDESHARAVRNAEALLAAGVTTVRDVGGPVEVLAQLDIGPHLLFAGRILCAPGGHGAEFPMPVPIAQECRGPAGFAAGVEAQLAAGAHLVKVALNGADGQVQLTDDELAAVVRTAHDAGVWVAAHASVNEAVAMAVRHGVDTIEHGNGLDRETAALALAQGITLVPTLCIFEELDPGLFPRDQQQQVRSAVEQRLRDHRTTLRSARHVGLPLAFGTDRVPGGDVVAVKEEAHALQAHGLSAEEVLAAATSGSAAALGLSDRGRLAPGLRADIIVVPGDLAHDLSGLGSPELVLISPR